MALRTLADIDRERRRIATLSPEAFFKEAEREAAKRIVIPTTARTETAPFVAPTVAPVPVQRVSVPPEPLGLSSKWVWIGAGVLGLFLLRKKGYI